MSPADHVGVVHNILLMLLYNLQIKTMTMCSVIWIVAVLQCGCVISQNVRLIPGPDKGRLEVQCNGTWGTVCQNSFKNQAASVICRSLNQPSNNAYWMNGLEYGVGYLKPRLSLVSCFGRETSLFDCSLTARTNSQYCSPSYVVGIVCTNEKSQAFFRYGSNWFNSAETLHVFERGYLSCYAGNNTRARDFTLKIKKGNSLVASRTHYTYYSPQRSEAGPFTCTVSNWQMSNQDSLTVQVNIMYPPLEFVISEIKVMEGTSINITLTNMPNPIPYLTTWRKTGTRLKWNQAEAYRTYSNISRADGGEFLVNISSQMNSSGNIVRHAHGLELILVDVQYQPTVKCEPEHIVSEGSKVNITCEVEANPSPHSYIWTNNSGDIIYRGSMPRLVIESVRPDNVGRYKCTALNHMQDSKGTITAGVGLAELSIMLKSDQPPWTTSPATEPPTTNSPATEPPTTTSPAKELPSQTSFTYMYAMIAVAVVSLVMILVLVVVIVKLRRNKDSEGPSARIPETNHRGSPVYENAAFTESDYTALKFPDSKSKKNRGRP